MATSDTLLPQLQTLFNELAIVPEVLAHPPVHTVEEAAPFWKQLKGAHTKNLFLRDAKGALFLVTLPMDRKVDLKKLPALIGSKRLSFGSAERMTEALHTAPGALGPLSLIMDETRRVHFAIDASLMAAEHITMHPLQNDRTLCIKTQDLRRFLHALGVEPVVVHFPQEDMA
ncbi:prolyl-tRNA synthetase associated domain-containing protein [Komagataeibacter sp. FNDCF1]|uniref:prolyl-tRNA synthetase associated domain-containing protein n=1 Tax=Komagataeibacter sp. FNDCF1 TaxID=2878681 RepID=UPI001E3E951B|nr:prolyl-tRNA synthetase associated domain-containing protein [Komagataeibacter sp. FNDCF1]MCE2564548.1 prolyl-tRNA synthetase associated domain-containing protein [Komagataeibacter sp. FNDCF1]